MDTHTTAPSEKPESIGDRITWTQVARFLVYLLLWPLVLFLSAGRGDWGWGWIYVGLATGATVLSRLLVARKNPDLLAERGSADQKENVQPGDRLLVCLGVLYIPALTLVTAGLDHRFGWSPAIPTWATILTLGCVLLGYALATWAMVVNRFFSSYVRIQSDRGQHVVSDGPYRFVRHPGYAGGVLGGLAGPVVLGSYWALIPALVSAAVLVLRTAREDRVLQEGLSGYVDYARRTRYRLLPGVW